MKKKKKSCCLFTFQQIIQKGESLEVLKQNQLNVKQTVSLLVGKNGKYHHISVHLDRTNGFYWPQFEA